MPDAPDPIQEAVAASPTHLPASAPLLRSPAPPQNEPLRAALKAARELIAHLRNGDFECFTVAGNAETMNDSEREIIAEYDAVLAQIDEVMK